MKELKYLTIGEEKMPVNLGLQQSINYCQLRGISISDMSKDFERMGNGQTNGSEFRDLIWSALKDGARKAKIDFELSPEDVSDIIEDLTPEQINEFMGVLTSSMGHSPDNPKKKRW